MNNQELDKLLRSVAEPGREADYWEDFPASVTRRMAQVRSPGFSRLAPRWFPRLAWGFGLAAACVVMGFILGFWKGGDSSAQELAALRKMYRETASLFPNQLRAIACDEQGVHLMLAEEANVPSSPPVFIKVCQGAQCHRFVTFSGEQIQFNGELYDVLVDAQGNVILAGRKMVWSSAAMVSAKIPYRIQARQMDEWL